MQKMGWLGLVLRLAFLVELRLVTDRQTQTQTEAQTQAHGYYRGCIASRDKKLSRQNAVHDQQSVSH